MSNNIKDTFFNINALYRARKTAQKTQTIPKSAKKYGVNNVWTNTYFNSKFFTWWLTLHNT